jgi:predicted nucleic acid-binding protein
VKDIYLDTNVLLRLFEDKAGKENAEKIVLLAKQDKVRLAISEWVINECVGGVQRKRNENKLTKQEAAEILTGIADLVEGKIEEVNLTLYPVTERVIRDSVTTIQEVRCNTAGDAIHVYVADRANCNYFVTADKGLASRIKNSGLRHKLVAVDIDELSDMLNFFSYFE